LPALAINVVISDPGVLTVADGLRRNRTRLDPGLRRAGQFSHHPGRSRILLALLNNIKKWTLIFLVVYRHGPHRASLLLVVRRGGQSSRSSISCR